MGAYEATAAELCGPAIVLPVSLVLAAAVKRLPQKVFDRLQKRGFSVHVSFGATMICVLQLLFSVVVKVVFQLITCQKVSSENRVVFIDGRKKCEGPLHSGLIAIAVDGASLVRQ